MVGIFKVRRRVVRVNDFKENFSSSTFDLSDDADLTVLGLVGTGISSAVFGADENFCRVIRVVKQNLPHRCIHQVRSIFIHPTTYI